MFLLVNQESIRNMVNLRLRRSAYEFFTREYVGRRLRMLIDQDLQSDLLRSPNVPKQVDLET